MQTAPVPDDATEHASHEDQLADEFGDESFPGSDPPAIWAGPDTPPDRH